MELWRDWDESSRESMILELSVVMVTPQFHRQLLIKAGAESPLVILFCSVVWESFLEAQTGVFNPLVNSANHLKSYNNCLPNV